MFFCFLSHFDQKTNSLHFYSCFGFTWSVGKLPNTFFAFSFSAFAHYSPDTSFPITILERMKSESTMDSPMITCAYAQAQILNERAMELSDFGQYDSALSILMKALQMWKSHGSAENREDVCLCCQCQGDCKDEAQSCMDIDEKDTSSSYVTRSVSQELAEAEEEHPNASEHGYMYREIIRIPCRKMFETRNVDSAVALIILFNLSIVQHLSSISSNNKKRMAKTLRLYQLSNECLNSFVNDTNTCSRKAGAYELGIIIHIILINNLSHLHSLMGNLVTSLQCTEKLVPILMCMVDAKARNNTVPEFSSGVWRISLEGFFGSICPLVLTSQCADAA